MKIGRLRTSVVAIAALTGFGCASVPERNSALEQARAAYHAAASDPTVAKQAGVELRTAAQALQRAENAWRDDEDQRVVEHRAYLARQRVEIARAAAQQRAAEQQIESATAERERVRLEARTREAEQQASAAQQARQEAQAARSRAQELESRLEELQAKRTDKGLVLTLGDVLFDTGSAVLKPGSARRMDQLASVLREYPEATITVEGFTDSTGSQSLNQRLSEERANAVRNALGARGIDASRITAVGYGAAAPVASNATPAGRQLNRRVEVVISTQGAPTASR